MLARTCGPAVAHGACVPWSHAKSVGAPMPSPRPMWTVLTNRWWEQSGGWVKSSASHAFAWPRQWPRGSLVGLPTKHPLLCKSCMARVSPRVRLGIRTPASWKLLILTMYLFLSPTANEPSGEDTAAAMSPFPLNTDPDFTPVSQETRTFLARISAAATIGMPERLTPCPFGCTTGDAVLMVGRGEGGNLVRRAGSLQKSPTRYSYSHIARVQPGSLAMMSRYTSGERQGNHLARAFLLCASFFLCFS